ncbi:LysM peptidoglycan-binding domain-containing protein [Apibacter raozihei]|uniref:amino acid ABC transporter substrate-binding protein n=1 Tax=Apibacter TaxID=1778601 RepID=UPI000FE424E5|nr:MULTISPECIES: LysM peptidoglycan-binding domain-containing protein [Apibacter]
MKKYFIILLTFFISSFFIAQQKKHVVEPKETLYGLSKKYNVTIDDLRKANPQLNTRVPQIGETLIIPDKNTIIETTKPSKPVKEVITSNNAIKTEENSSDYIFITVEPKETLYRLSKKYGTTVENLRKLNPNMDEKGPKIGEILKVPAIASSNSDSDKSTTKKDKEKNKTKNKQDIQETTETEIISSTVPDTTVDENKPGITKDALNIVLFLPFYPDTTGFLKEKEISTQFYSGVRLALDSLTHKGKKINLEILDSGNDTKFQNSLSTYDFSNTHLIIGPLFKSSLKQAADVLNKIPIVSPFTSSDDLDTYDNLILYDTKEQILAEKLVNEMLKKYDNEKVYIVYDDDHNQTAAFFKSYILNKKSKAEIILTKNVDDIKPVQNLVTDEYNKFYTILVSDQNSLTQNYLDHLIEFDRDQVQPISLFYSSLFDDKKYMDKLLDLGLIYSDTNYVNEYGFNEQKTINIYKKKFCTIPGKYAVAGFDVTYDIISRMDSKGSLSNSAMKTEGKQLSNKYSFIRVKKNGAWANQGARIIQLLK